MKNTNNNLLEIVAQAFYGNRVATEIHREDVDRFILGYMDNDIVVTEKLDRTMVKVPNTNDIVIVYNKYAEEEAKNKGFKKPLVAIPSENIELHSRCIVCKVDEDGELDSLQREDFDKFMTYLAE